MTTLTHSTRPIRAKEIVRKWHLFDLSGKVLGRMTTQISNVLQGKNKVNYVNHLDMGDNVVVVNASKLELTGKKEQTKTYDNYSGYPGGLRKVTFKEQMERDPTKIVRHAVSGMLPKNKLRDQRLARLFIFKDENHPYKDKFGA